MNSTVVPATTPATPPANPANKAPVLLFVDDEPAILSALRRIFRPPGYQVLLAASGAEGLSILEKENVQMVISDARMPEMDGATFLKEVYRRWPHVLRIMLTGYADITTTISAINEAKIFCYLNKPWDDAELKTTIDGGLRQFFLENERARLEAITREQKNQLEKMNASLESQVRARTAELQQTADMLDASYDELKATYETTVRVFSSLIHLRKGLSNKSTQRILSAVRKLAQELKFSENETRDVVMAASLFNLGKIAWPDELITRPFESLTPDQWVEVKKYPLQAENLLMALDPLKDTARLIRNHQESYDGRGFPDGLSGDAIPMGSRILKLVIDFDALVSGGLQLKPVPVANAIEYIKQHAGKTYDPTVVALFIDVMSRGSAQETAKEQASERMIYSNQLTPNMELSRDLYSSDDILLLNKGKKLNDLYIARILAFERAENAKFSIYVRIDNDVDENKETSS